MQYMCYGWCQNVENNNLIKLTWKTGLFKKLFSSFGRELINMLTVMQIVRLVGKNFDFFIMIN